MTETNTFEFEGKSIDFPLIAAEKLYNNMKSIMGGSEITTGNITGILLSLMQIVEKYENISGEQKKAIILSTLFKFLDDSSLEDDDKIQLKILVQTTLPSVIDAFVSLDKSKMVIKLKKGCGNILLSCVPK
jgi:hypothetical protein